MCAEAAIQQERNVRATDSALGRIEVEIRLSGVHAAYTEAMGVVFIVVAGEKGNGGVT